MKSLTFFSFLMALGLTACSTPQEVKQSMDHSSYDRQQQAAQQADRQLDRETSKLK